ncbi:hypothetical protein CRENBAI_024738 [Crenichthys baileyi]|uniref:Uncharacterized protein n=1 Tax=Crenichthys baileyi TaxID=28760 RepID=A0AAV9QNY8_9TELE
MCSLELDLKLRALVAHLLSAPQLVRFHLCPLRVTLVRLIFPRPQITEIYSEEELPISSMCFPLCLSFFGFLLATPLQREREREVERARKREKERSMTISRVFKKLTQDNSGE